MSTTNKYTQRLTTIISVESPSGSFFRAKEYFKENDLIALKVISHNFKSHFLRDILNGAKTPEKIEEIDWRDQRNDLLCLDINQGTYANDLLTAIGGNYAITKLYQIYALLRKDTLIRRAGFGELILRTSNIFFVHDSQNVTKQVSLEQIHPNEWEIWSFDIEDRTKSLPPYSVVFCPYNKQLHARR